MDAAKDSGAILWSDDVGLRRLARGEGVKTFGTLSLLTLARERGRIDETEADWITRTLIREFTVDLPFNLAVLEAVAVEDSWPPWPVATVLARPATRRDIGAAETLLHHALRHAHEDHHAQWSYAAIARPCRSIATTTRQR